MVDKVSKEVRSYNMSRIRSKDTKPEILVRSYLFSERMIRGILEVRTLYCQNTGQLYLFMDVSGISMRGANIQ